MVAVSYRRSTMVFVVACLLLAMSLSVLVLIGAKVSSLHNCSRITWDATAQDFGSANSSTESSSFQSPFLTIITGFSSNHLMEGILMLRSLIRSNYTGPVVVYLLHRKGEVLSDDMRVHLPEQLSNSTLDASVVVYEVEEYEDYCFKPRLIHDYLYDATISNSRPAILYWADASIRHRSNPSNWATAMVQDDVDFAGTISVLGMGENTHEDTYRYLNMSREGYKQYTEIRSGVWLMNLQRNQAETHLLQPWMDCAIRACHTCMAPIGSIKKLSKPWKGPPSTEVIVHRQDQSVLSLLTYRSKNKTLCNVVFNNPKYLRVGVERGTKATSLDLVNF